eukprot:TRINITY_DN5058_c0_g2_i5.p2 TRINITY_DN5058_c0_g2~~TRINITY_DN5058_c0_g2_i5.p2  ORF type:complete len:183 (+),score=11.43 TRINITY_DN5058_c0_g2_i5:198-746(+)
MAQWGLYESQCAQFILEALSTDRELKLLKRKMEEAGCPIGSRFFSVEACKGKAIGGGFMPGLGVIVCHDQLSTYSEVRNALVHELIHAYDHCRVRDLDFGNCKHLACTEVRAANLSGDCKWYQEFLRGNATLYNRAQHRKCAMRRAQLSVSMSAHCKYRAQECVEEVFEECMQDTQPFGYVP